MTQQVHDQVRERYAESARQVLATNTAACCGEQGIGPELYSALDSTTKPCVLCKDNSAHPAGGVSIGLEAGTTVFGALTGRISPFGK